MIFSKKAAAFLLAVLLLGGSLAPKSYAEAKAIGGRANDDMKIALTFDDGPHPKNTPKILDILAEYGIKATFFEVGENIELYPEVSRRVVAEGHEIGNHTYTHAYISKISEDALRKEIQKTEDVLREITGERPVVFRPPGGYYNDASLKVVEKMGYRSVLWSLDTRDWSMLKCGAIVSKVEKNVKGGDIILFHDLEDKRLATPAALREILPFLVENGYEFVTISQMIENEAD